MQNIFPQVRGTIKIIPEWGFKVRFSWLWRPGRLQNGQYLDVGQVAAVQVTFDVVQQELCWSVGVTLRRPEAQGRTHKLLAGVFSGIGCDLDGHF
jgi:hypothetical protein